MKNIFILSCIVGIFFSCKKGDDNGNYYMSCDIDGVSKTFNMGLFCHPEWGSGNKAVTINGLTSFSSNTASMGWVITNLPSKDSIIPGVYNDTSTKFEVLASYVSDQSTSGDYEAGTSEYAETQRDGVTIINHFVVEITSLTNQSARGKFSGDFYFNGDTHGKKITVTNGSFYAPIVQ